MKNVERPIFKWLENVDDVNVNYVNPVDNYIYHIAFAEKPKKEKNKKPPR